MIPFENLVFCIIAVMAIIGLVVVIPMLSTEICRRFK